MVRNLTAVIVLEAHTQPTVAIQQWWEVTYELVIVNKNNDFQFLSADLEWPLRSLPIRWSHCSAECCYFTKSLLLSYRLQS